MLQCPLDGKGCDICNVGVTTCVAALRHNYPHLHAQIDLKVIIYILSQLVPLLYQWYMLQHPLYTLFTPSLHHLIPSTHTTTP